VLTPHGQAVQSEGTILLRYFFSKPYVANLVDISVIDTATNIVTAFIQIDGALAWIAIAPIPGPDLTGAIVKLKGETQPSGDKLVVRLTVSNIGSETASGPFSVSLFLSDDDMFDSEDVFIETFTIKRIKPGRTKVSKKGKRRFKVAELEPVAGKFTIIVIDEDDNSAERNEQNNILVQQIVLDSLTFTPEQTLMRDAVLDDNFF
jgi:YVTN family beta-propeller protein